MSTPPGGQSPGPEAGEPRLEPGKRRLINRHGRPSVVLAILGVVALLAGAAVVVHRIDTPTPGGDYLALGDSLAFGYQPGGAVPPPVYRDAATFVGYPEDVASSLRLKVVNASCPGETIASMMSTAGLSNGCENTDGTGSGYRTTYPLHIRYSGSQLGFALRYLREHRNVRLVTIDLGLNDVAVCEQITPDNCGKASEQASLRAEITNGLATIYRDIRTEADYQGPLVAVSYYAVAVADRDLASNLNKLMSVVAEQYGVVTADGYGAFDRGSASSGGDACRAGLLIPLRNGTCDQHASARGQAVLAAAVVKVSSPDAGEVQSAAESGNPLLKGGDPLLGVIRYSGRYDRAEQAAGVRAVTIQVEWHLAQPRPSSFDGAYLARVNALIRRAGAAGFSVVIDPGTQYPPSWVFDLPGGTRFIDQYGDVFTGAAGSGNDVANAVTDPAIRSALARYLSWLGAGLDRTDVVAVRQGGGPLGELRYPDESYAGHTDCYWAYDRSSRATWPALRYRPGTGDPGEAMAFLARYNADLISFADWMNARYRADFDRVTLVVLPGWGERPGVAAEEATSLLRLHFPEFNQGLDWSGLLASLPDRSHSIAYTTYLDAPSFGTTSRSEDPAAFLAALVGPLHMSLGGENTNSDRPSSLTLSLQRAEALHLRIVCWFDEANLAAASSGNLHAPTFAQLGAAGRDELSS